MHVVVATVKTNAVKGERRCQSRNVQNGFWFMFFRAILLISVLFSCIGIPQFSIRDRGSNNQLAVIYSKMMSIFSESLESSICRYVAYYWNLNYFFYLDQILHYLSNIKFVSIVLNKQYVLTDF